ncbi:MAG: acyltransferase [Acidimicrobiales bacterium]
MRTMVGGAMFAHPDPMTSPRRPSLAPAPPVAAGRSVDALVDATPASRDRYVDLLRALSIVVVVLWHWMLSVTYLDHDGAITMPNPVGDIRLMWLATWLLQIMPVFFFVGGFANLATLDAMERKGDGRWSTFASKRLSRLLRPIGVFVAVWAAGDTLARVALDDYESVLRWGIVVFVPLWFLGMYTAVVLLAPLTARLHRRGRELTLVAMGVAIVLADLGRFRFGLEQLGLLNAALIWIFAHQLGYFWRDGTFTGWARRTLWTMALAGLTALVVLTNLGVYPRSMVAVRGEAVSNMFPTTACIAALAIFQMAVAMLLRPAAERWLARRRNWKAVVSVNAVAMTVFTWHMTALVAVLGLYRSLDFTLQTRPTAAWWWQRPLWLLAPGVILAGLVTLFARVELPRRPDPTSPG